MVQEKLLSLKQKDQQDEVIFEEQTITQGKLEDVENTAEPIQESEIQEAEEDITVQDASEDAAETV